MKKKTRRNWFLQRIRGKSYMVSNLRILYRTMVVEGNCGKVRIVVLSDTLIWQWIQLDVVLLQAMDFQTFLCASIEFFNRENFTIS